MNKILRVFLDVDMRNQHKGLADLAIKHRVKINTLDPGEHVVFVNSSFNKVKLFSSSGVISYMRKDKGKIDIALIEKIPNSFNSFGRVDWARAERQAIESRLNKGNSSSFKERKNLAKAMKRPTLQTSA